MNRPLFMLLALLLFGASQASVGATTTISKEVALQLVKSKFAGHDYDYYLYSNPRKLEEIAPMPGELIVPGPQSNVSKASGDTVGTPVSNKYYPWALLTDIDKYFWQIFVDADPGANWAHKAYLYTIWREVPDGEHPIYLEETLTGPSATGFYTALSVKDRGGHGNMPVTPRPEGGSLDANRVDTTATHTYAMIISGGLNKYYNYKRYWNDCSFIYQTLRKTYGVPKENIALFMGDGNDPADDMRVDPSTYASSPLDLDYDGVDDLELAATNANISAHLTELASTLTEEDHLFVYVIDHGGTNGGDDAFIYLWGGEKLTDTSLAEQLKPLTDNYVAVNVLLGQCNAGGFVGDLEEIGCVVTAACGANENSYAMPNGNFDNFVYHWTSAINGSDPYGKPVEADSDGNGYVSMREAFLYADANSTRIDENPLHASKPVYLAYDLAFNNIPPSVDLYIKDHPRDMGVEPSITDKSLNFWTWSDLWFRRKNDGGKENQFLQYEQNDDFSRTGGYINAIVTNRGRKPYIGSMNSGYSFVHFYWAEMSTNIPKDTWYGYDNQDLTVGSGHACMRKLDKVIDPGEALTIVQIWYYPVELSDYLEEVGHCPIGMLAEISTSNKGRDDKDPTKMYFDVVNDRKTAMRNSTAYDPTKYEPFHFNIRNYLAKACEATIAISRSDETATLPGCPDIALRFPKKLGSIDTSQNDQICTSNGPLNPTYHVAQLPYGVVDIGTVKNVTLDARESMEVELDINFTAETATGKEYIYHISQKDEDGNVLGGLSIIIKSPTVADKMIGIETKEIADGSYLLTPDTSVDGYAVSWKDASGSRIASGESVTVTPTPSNRTYTMVAISPEGELSEDAVTLDIADGIKNVAVGSSSLQVEFRNPVMATDAVLSVTSAINPTHPAVSVPVSAGTGSQQVAIDQLPTGVYVLTYSANGSVVDSYKFTRK